MNPVFYLPLIFIKSPVILYMFRKKNIHICTVREKVLEICGLCRQTNIRVVRMSGFWCGALYVENT